MELKREGKLGMFPGEFPRGSPRAGDLGVVKSPGDGELKNRPRCISGCKFEVAVYLFFISVLCLFTSCSILKKIK